ncbi:MAG: hypothetical protein LBT59_27525 [Clostridiales bacterium]|nr:hypothetical protein [Clostridiales bacterium]
MSESDYQDIAPETLKAKVLGIALEISNHFESHNWTNISRKETPYGSIVFRFYMNVKKVPLTIDTFVTEVPLTVKILVTLPTVCSPEYSIIVDSYITEYNYGKRYGSLNHDKRDGALEYEYNYSVAHSFNADDFDTYFNACVFSAANAYPEISKLCVGRLSKAKLDDVNNKVATLVNALDD